MSLLDELKKYFALRGETLTKEEIAEVVADGIYKGEAESDTNPGTPANPCWYGATTGVSYQFFLDQGGQPITVPRDVVVEGATKYVVSPRLVWNETFWALKYELVDEPDLSRDYIPQSQKGVPNGVAELDENGELPGYVANSKVNQPNGVAGTDSTNKISVELIPNETVHRLSVLSDSANASISVGGIPQSNKRQALTLLDDAIVAIGLFDFGGRVPVMRQFNYSYNPSNQTHSINAHIALMDNYNQTTNDLNTIDAVIHLSSFTGDGKRTIILRETTTKR